MNQLVEGSPEETFDLRTCESCREPGLSVRTATQVFPYGDGANAVDLEASVQIYSCPHCGFEYTDEFAEDARHEAVCRHLGVMTPLEIRSLREDHFVMSREKFSRVTGLGVATLARWEGALLIQNEANDRYLRLLAAADNRWRIEAIAERRDYSAPPALAAKPRRFPSLDHSPRIERMKGNFQLHKVR